MTWRETKSGKPGLDSSMAGAWVSWESLTITITVVVCLG